MPQDELDRILARNVEIRPSGAFAAGVMEKIRNEASAPPPIPFPWRISVLGIATGASLSLGALVLLGQENRAFVQAELSRGLAFLVNSTTVVGRIEMGWLIAALASVWVSLKVSKRLVEAPD